MLAAMVKRSASAPCALMPSGNSFRVAFSIFAAICGCISPLVRLATRSSRAMPSMMSIGSRMLPFDFDIFWPSLSRTRPVMYTSRNGTCPVRRSVTMIIRATQKKMMSKPVTSTLDGR